jgi:hypothetical protein
LENPSEKLIRILRLSSMEKEQLKNEIMNAFREVKYPKNNLGSPDIEIEDFLRKDWKNWQDIPKHIIERNIDELSFFSPEGYQFVLPAYMTFSLDDMDNTMLVDYTVASLKLPNFYRETENYTYHIFMSRVPLFTSEQVESIIRFLKYVETKIFTDIPNEATEALNGYWARFRLGG